VVDDPQASVVVCEKENVVAAHQTGRNSGVVHAGLYYEPGSLKARLCRRGGELLHAYCVERGLPYEECGKIVVARRADEIPRVERIAERASANGVPGIRILDAAGLRDVEPYAAGVAALHSPTTAIVDYKAVTATFAADVRAAGGEVRLQTAVRRVCGDGTRPTVQLAGGETIRCDRVIVCAGLHADRLAAASGESAAPVIVPFRGEYFALTPERASLVNGLIYPVPDPDLPFLGVHVTKHVGGGVLVGPNAVLATAREGYTRRSFDRRDMSEMLATPATWRLFGRWWQVGASEMMRSGSRRLFARSARQLMPSLRAADLVPAPAGVRAQAVDRDGTLVDDFRISVRGDVVWVRNAPSPAATSSMAIAEELLQRFTKHDRASAH
jgi:L-2-hydroxyglutarate oxidase LhgO